jgi:NADH-quinone oxidoreductase subunit M
VLLSVTGVILGAWYMLWLVQRLFFGPVREPRGEPGSVHGHSPADLAWREIAALVPLAVFIVWIGVQPRFFLDRMEPTLTGIANVAETSLLNRMRSEERMAGARPAVRGPAGGNGDLAAEPTPGLRVAAGTARALAEQQTGSR